MAYAFSQMFEIAALVITLAAYHRKEKRNIFQGMIVANVLDMMHYMLLDAYSGMATKIIALVRNIIIVQKENHRWLNSPVVPALLCCSYVGCAIATYNGLLSLFPIAAALIYMTVVWCGDAVAVKRIAFFCYFLWLAYNIYVASIFGIVSNILSLASTWIAYRRAASD